MHSIKVGLNGRSSPQDSFPLWEKLKELEAALAENVEMTERNGATAQRAEVALRMALEAAEEEMGAKVERKGRDLKEEVAAKVEMVEATLREEDARLSRETNAILAGVRARAEESLRRVENRLAEVERSMAEGDRKVAQALNRTLGNRVGSVRAGLEAALEGAEESSQREARSMFGGVEEDLRRLEARYGRLVANLTQREDCSGLKEFFPVMETGAYPIDLPGIGLKRVRCNMDAAAGGTVGATVILRRGDFGQEDEDHLNFDRGKRRTCW